MNFFSKHKKILFFVSIILMLVLLTFGKKENFHMGFIENTVMSAVGPVEKISSSIMYHIKNFFTSFSNRQELHIENAELKKELNELKEKINRIEFFEKENIKLHAQLNLERRYQEYEKIFAYAIAKDPSSWSNKMIIDKGSKHGIEPKMLVLSNFSVIGYTQKVSSRYTQLVCLTDEQAVLSVMNKRTEDLAVLHGDIELSANNLCRIEYIKIDAEMIEGDEIVTSSYGGFPAGIPIGQVKEIKLDASGMTKYAIVELHSSLEESEVLTVVKEKYKDPLEELNP